MTLKIDVAPGELIDKMTILEIKLAQIDDRSKRENVLYEYQSLIRAYEAGIAETPVLAELRAALKSINETIWQVEDEIRAHERRQDFGSTFIALARAVYVTNDERAAIKRQINELLDSDIIEEKSYEPY